MRRIIWEIGLVVALLLILLVGYQVWILSNRLAPLEAMITGPSPMPDVPTEVRVLRAQIALMRQYDERLLETVFWALTAVFGLAAVLTGFGWYANFRLYERDKASMRQELQGMLGIEIGKVREASLKAAEVAVGQAVAKAVRELSDRVEGLQKLVGGQALELKMMDVENWRAKRVEGNVLLTLAEAAEIAVGIGMGWKLDEILREIIELLEGGFKPDPAVTTSVEQMLRKLPSGYASVVAKIRRLLSS